MRDDMGRKPESMEFPRREFESVCFHAIGLVDQNREYLQMHLRESGDAPTRQALADMELQTARLERTLSEMMDLMALEEDPVPSRRGFDLCSVLRQAASLREEMARQAKVHLTVSCEPDTCPVLGSPEEAELMVFHLLSNALRASAPGGKIVLRLCRAEDAWQLTVTDHGCGLPGPANWQENRRRFLGGAGAGLKICRAVCRRAGWGFALEAGSGGGAEAVVTLPMEPETAASGDTIALHAAGEVLPSRLRWQLEREQAFLAHEGSCFAIYQVSRDDPQNVRFMNLDWLKSHAISIDRSNYDLIYTAPLRESGTVPEQLEKLYQQFNLEKPVDFHSPSMSVSDIVAIRQDGKVSCHYCDSVGFTQIPGFLPENPLKNAEMAVEDDYGMIDGIINNGAKEPTVAELEQQARSGQPISLMELAAATHREEREKKKSVMEQLKGQPKTEHKKTAPKKSAEREI